MSHLCDTRYRQAGAAARAMLLQAAAQRLNVPAASLRTGNGAVVNGMQRIRYGELAQRIAATPQASLPLRLSRLEPLAYALLRAVFGIVRGGISGPRSGNGGWRVAQARQRRDCMNGLTQARKLLPIVADVPSSTPPPPMDRFDALQLFTRIVELGSFTGAASALEIPRATATHAIKELEARVGARLLERTTRQVRPTLDGQAFYERSKRVLQDLEDAETSLSTQVANPRGTLRLDLHGTHATMIILPRIGEFRARYPHIDLVISSGDRLVDLVGEGIDCVVRAGRPRDSSLVAKRLADMPEVLCASPEYLSAHGTPQHPSELANHVGVGFFSRNSDNRYPFTLNVDGEVREFRARGWISVSDAACYTSAALAGCGLIQVPRFRVEEHLRAGRLVPVLQAWPCPDLPVSALYPFHRQLAPRVRVFVDWVSGLYVERFGPLRAAA